MKISTLYRTAKQFNWGKWTLAKQLEVLLWRPIKLIVGKQMTVESVGTAIVVWSHRLVSCYRYEFTVKYISNPKLVPHFLTACGRQAVNRRQARKLEGSAVTPMIPTKGPGWGTSIEAPQDNHKGRWNHLPCASTPSTQHSNSPGNATGANIHKSSVA